MTSFIHTASDPPRIREIKVKVLELRRKRWEEKSSKLKAAYGLAEV